MTTFPGSPQVLKGAIVGIDIFNPVSSVAVFQYNPEQLSRSVTPRYSEAGGGRAEPLRLQGPPTETISATLQMDVIDQLERGETGPLGGGLTGYIAALEMLAYPKTIQVAINQALMLAGTMEVLPPVAPLTLFIYGWKRVVPVKLESLSITETAHDPDLNPIRADVALSMKVLTYNDLSMTHPGYWAFIAHQVIKEVYATAASIDNIANFGAVLGAGPGS
ncbi:hypothetical protein [Sphingomonas sp. SUN039]|uniref:hypothetical protein n=1 Tax=Sphingomonas sp. SUN039 TaxID=2937787 RepID=UPI002164E88A|nr:hypothetical protein [Sphingomonas sp. SUN039]UVO55698.1 hypothetical protein M0209_16845 [Sphingomonas sp. SUN039]